MPKKKQPDIDSNDNLDFQQQDSENSGMEEEAVSETGEFRSGLEDVTEPLTGTGGQNVDDDGKSFNALHSDEDGDAPPRADDMAEDLPLIGDSDMPTGDSLEPMGGQNKDEYQETGDMPDGAYGNLGDPEDEDDLYGDGDAPPQFDLPDVNNPPEGALMLDSDGSFTQEELTAAAMALADGGLAGSEDAASAPARRRRRSTTPSEETATALPETPAAAPTRRRATSSTSNVLSIDETLKVQSSEDKDALLWMELRGSLRSKRILTGTMGGVERNPAGGCIAVVYYKEQRIVIPAEEMFIDINVHQTESNREIQNRYAQILTRNLNAEVDFIISGIDRRGNSVVASRKEAMIRKQVNYYHPSARRRNPVISEGMIVEARIISVGTKNIRVEVFGVETTIWARYVAWEWVEDCSDYFQVGDRVLLKVMSIDRSNPEHLTIEASIRDCFPNPALQNIEKCHTQGKYIGKVTGMDTRAIYVRLNVGVNGIATACHDRKVPGRKDDVSFVITKIDKDQGVAIGIITKIIKQHF